MTAKFLKKLALPLVLLPSLAFAAPTDLQTPAEPRALNSVRIAVWNNAAFEKEGDAARIAFVRDDTRGALTVTFGLTGAKRASMGSASPNDYRLSYGDREGDVVNNQVIFLDGRKRVVVDIKPARDEIAEVPEALTFFLREGPGYLIGSDQMGQIRIYDAKDTPENIQNLTGLFRPQDGARTSATGAANLAISGDNSYALLTYRFEGLSAPQTTQHVHVNPTGQVTFDIPDDAKLGGVRDVRWNLAPGGAFVTRQEMLDALLNGEMYVNIHSSNYPAGEIAAILVPRDQGLPPQPTPPPAGPMTRDDSSRDILRFLNQATFGATPETFRALRNAIEDDGSNRLEEYERWIDRQFALPQSRLKELVEVGERSFGIDGRRFFLNYDASWTMLQSSRDQLRLRTTFALSQILVVSDADDQVKRAHLGWSDYLDTLGENAFGTYRGALGEVTRHPVMAKWLTYLSNRKENPDLGVSPDENYAREIMQLFTFGLVQRRPNGNVIIDQETGLPLPNYDNRVIQELARVFTGLSFRVRDTPGGRVIPNREFDLRPNSASPQQKWQQDLMFFPAHHDYGRKVLFTDRGATFVVPASRDQSARIAEQELDYVLDGLVAHSSTAPNISRLLIQRFVTSNPSPGYIRRVSSVFGQEGDMKAVIKAILLDDEARNINVIESETFGKLKEPVLMMSGLFRVLQARSQVPLSRDVNGLDHPNINHYDRNATFLAIGTLDVGQYVFGAPSVFNFFLPDFSPPGPLANQGLTAPELEINTESQMYSSFNVVDQILNGGLLRFSASRGNRFSAPQLRVRPDFSILRRIWDNTPGSNEAKATAVVDHLDRYLNSGFLRATGDIGTRLTIIDAVSSARGDDRFKLAIYGITNSPKSMVQR